MAELLSAERTPAEILGQFIADHGRTPFAWGTHDCCTWLADWILLRRGGRDPAHAFRGLYDEQSANQIVFLHGGLAALLGELARAAGLKETLEPRLGDVGLVEGQGADGSLVTAGAICCGRRWACLTLGGIYARRVEPIVAWRV